MMPLRQAILSGGVLFFFGLSSLAQESLTASRTFDGNLLVFVQSTSACVFAYAATKVCGHTRNAEWRRSEWLLVVVPYFCSHYFGLASLKHLSYPVHVTFKSCKAIPVVIGERLFTSKIHPLGKTLGVLAMSVGVLLFFLGDASKVRSVKKSTSLLGVLLVSLALLADGMYAGAQASLVRKSSEFVLMFRMNLYQSLLSLLFLGRPPLPSALVLRDLLAFAVCKALGTLCVYRLLRECGTLPVATVTTLRKVLTVALSVLAFGHSLTSAQHVALSLVFLHSYVGHALAAVFDSSRRGLLLLQGGDDDGGGGGVRSTKGGDDDGGRKNGPSSSSSSKTPVVVNGGGSNAKAQNNGWGFFFFSTKKKSHRSKKRD